ncbi:MAG: DUF2807 domain-containing protein [Bacteroidota bacterium]
MKTIISFWLIICPLTIWAQISGNGQRLTESFRLDQIERITIAIPASIEMSGKPGQSEAIDISMDENLFAYLNIVRDHQGVSLRFREEVRPSRPILIRLDAPKLKRLDTGLGNTTYIRELQTEEFQLQALSGQAVVSGTVGTFRLMSESGQIDASGLQAEEAVVNLWQEATANLWVADKIEAWVSGNAQVKLTNEPRRMVRHEKGNGKILGPNNRKGPQAYVSLNLQNDDPSFLNTYVKGPDGQRFSYGLPFKSGQLRAERFPIGTRIYAGNNAVFSRLLYEVSETDEGQTISLTTR